MNMTNIQIIIQNKIKIYNLYNIKFFKKKVRFDNRCFGRAVLCYLGQGAANLIYFGYKFIK